MIVGERGYAVKERGIINVKGKGNMKTYFILGRKISRRIGRGSGAANNNLAEVVYGMVRARRRRTFKRDRDNHERHESSSTDRVSESGDGRERKKSESSTKLSRRNPISRSIRRSVVGQFSLKVWNVIEFGRGDRDNNFELVTQSFPVSPVLHTKHIKFNKV